MANSFRIRYCNADSTVQGDKVCSQLPVRMGRNQLNDCQIAHRYISDFHAQLELVDGQLCVRDLHSKNGIYSPSGERVAAKVPFELTPPNHDFVLGQFVRVQVEVFERSGTGADDRLSRSMGVVLGNQAALRPGGSQPLGALPPLSARGAASFAHPPPPPAAGGGWPNQGSMMASLPELAPVQQGYARNDASPAAAQQLSRPAHQGTSAFTMQVEMLALLGLKELAGSLVPGAELQTTGDVARLITKLHDAVEVFCRCFVPLREGYSQFVSQMDLRRAASQRTLNRSPSALRVETAKDPASLAAALLDWRNQDYDVPQAVEGIFADLMIHQIAMIDSVMR
ncbi:MAG TPA: FHA domain-containing protein, partial [Polyangiaceae bacterium]|nr:FHA domain-containing protein [Polyangiaceae bacterium]